MKAQKEKEAWLEAGERFKREQEETKKENLGVYRTWDTFKAGNYRTKDPYAYG